MDSRYSYSVPQVERVTEFTDRNLAKKIQADDDDDSQKVKLTN